MYSAEGLWGATWEIESPLSPTAQIFWNCPIGDYLDFQTDYLKDFYNYFYIFT